MNAATYPKATLETKWGTLAVTFLDPDAIIPGEYGYDRVNDARVPKRVGRCAVVTGELTINRIRIRVSESYEYALSHYRNGVELAAPVPEFRPVWSYSHNRRVDDSFREPPEGVRRTLHRDVAEAVRVFYESRPDLQREAKRTEILRQIESAEAEAEAARAALEAALQRTKEAQQELRIFDRA